MDAVKKNSNKKTALFICTHNSARSQMAEGFLNHLYGDRYEAFSAGTEPSKVHPLAVAVMKEVGVDISSHQSKSVEKFIHQDINYVVTVCDKAKQSCPFFPGGKEILHQGFEDPSQASGSKDEILETFRRIRDDIKEWIKETFGDSQPGR